MFIDIVLKIVLSKEVEYSADILDVYIIPVIYREIFQSRLNRALFNLP